MRKTNIDIQVYSIPWTHVGDARREPAACTEHGTERQAVVYRFFEPSTHTSRGLCP